MNHIKTKQKSQGSILVVDDDAKYLLLLESQLKNNGYRVECAGSGESALSMLSAFRPDLIILDIVMPGMDGFEVFEHLRGSAGTKNTPVIFLSVKDLPEDKVKGLELGAVDYIIKPFSITELLARVNTHLELKRKRDIIEEMNKRLKSEIKKREMAERAYRESIEKFEIVAEKSLLGTFIWRKKGFEYVNPAFAHIFGSEPEKMVKMKFEDIIHPEDCSIFTGKLEKLINGDLSSTQYQYRGVTKKGGIKYLEVYKARIMLKDQPAVIGTIIDITHKKAMENALNKKTRQLEQLNKTLEKRIEEEVEKQRKQEQFLMQQAKLAAMGEMVGAIAHQWRQPLSTVGFIIENILDDIEHDILEQGTLEKSLNNAVKQIKYMSKTIDDFKTFFKPARMREDYDIIKTTGETLSILCAELENKEIKVTFNHQIDTLLTNGFPNQFKQVLMNLINNGKDAIMEKRKQEATPNREGEIVISISRKLGDAVIKVEDNGSGVPESVINRIFEPYFSTKEQGLGIGLYMSKVIVEEHMKGKLYLGNAKTGTKFILELPCL